MRVLLYCVCFSCASRYVFIMHFSHRLFFCADGDRVPVPHSGLAMTVDQFHLFAGRLRKHGVKFIIDPHLRFKVGWLVDSLIRVFAGNLGGLGFLQSVFYINSIPTHEKAFAVGKSGPNTTFNLIFFGLGWPWVGEFVGSIIIFICFPTQQIW